MMRVKYHILKYGLGPKSYKRSSQMFNPAADMQEDI